MKIKRLPAPYFNYVQFTYCKQNGDVSERDVMVYHIDKVTFNCHNNPNSGIKDCLILAFDIDRQETRSFKLDGISEIIESFNGLSFSGINKYVWINNLYQALQMESVIEEESHEQPQINQETNTLKYVPIECIGFTGDTVLLLNHMIANKLGIETDGAIKWIVMNNLTQGFVADTKDGKVRYLNVKEFLELMK